MVAPEVVAPADEQAEAGAESQVDGTEPQAADVPGDGEPDEAMLAGEGETEEQEGEPGAGQAGEPEPPPEPSDIAALVAANPWLQAQLDEREQTHRNAGAQQREERLKREAGNQEQTQANVARLLAAWDDVEPEEREQRASYAYSLASANAAMELAKGFAESLTKQFTLPVEVRERAIEHRETGNFDDYVTELMAGARMAYLGEVEFSDLPAGSKLHTGITAEVNRRVADEITAKGLEAQPVQAAPPTAPRGGPPTSKDGPTPAEYEAATFEQRKKWKDDGVEVRV